MKTDNLKINFDVIRRFEIDESKVKVGWTEAFVELGANRIEMVCEYKDKVESLFQLKLHCG